MKTVAKAQKKAPARKATTKARPKMAKTGRRG
jgi:hypothetical protein